MTMQKTTNMTMNKICRAMAGLGIAAMLLSACGDSEAPASGAANPAASEASGAANTGVTGKEETAAPAEIIPPKIFKAALKRKRRRLMKPPGPSRISWRPKRRRLRLRQTL